MFPLLFRVLQRESQSMSAFATRWLLPASLLLVIGSGPLANPALAQRPDAPQPNAPAPNAPNPAANNAQQFRYWTTNWSFEDINVGRLLGRLRRIGIDVPIDADGDVTLNFSVSIPLNALRNGQAYRFNGTLSSPQLRLEELLLANLSTDVRYEAGVLTLSNLSTRWVDLRAGGGAASQRTGGQLEGTASLELVPRGDLAASLRARDLAVGPLYDLILAATDNTASPVLTGSLGGTLAVSAPLDSVSDVQKWNLDADLQAENLAIDGTLPLTLDTGPLSLRAGTLRADDLRIGSPVDPDVRLVASISTELEGERPFDVTLRGNDVPLQSIAKLVSLGDEPPVTGKLDIDARGSGELGQQGLASAQWNLAGRLASPQLTLFGLQLGLIEHDFEFDTTHVSLAPLDDLPNEQAILNHFAANYEIGEAAVELSEVDAAAFGGTITGSARFARGGSGSHRAQLQWQSIQPRLDTSYLLPASVNVSLRTSGEVDWTVPADSVDRPAAHQGTARIAVDQVLIGEASVGNAQLVLTADGGELDLQGSGNLFGGSFRVDTTTRVAADAAWSDLTAAARSGAVGGTLSLVRVDLAQASQVLRRQGLLPRNGRRVQGLVSGDIRFADSSDDSNTAPQQREALVRLTLDQLVIDSTLLTRRIEAGLRVRDNTITVDSLRGSYAGGQVEAVGQIRFGDGQSRLQVRVSGIDASQGLLPISANAADWAGGSLSARLTIESGARLRARGAIEVRDTEVFAISAGTAHASLAASAENDLSRWTLNLSLIESSVGNGRITGEADFRSSSTRPGAFDLSSQWQARRLDFGRLLHDSADGASSYARGNLSGNLTLSGRGIRSAADLVGRFDAELDGTQARAIPGLPSAQAYLGAFSLASTRFDQGEMRGSIGAGAARFDEFWLLSERMRVWADGRIRLDNGRMDMTAIISTGNFDVENVALAAVARQLALEAAFPVSALIQINRLLSDRTLYVDLVGPVSDPRLRLKPLATLREEAARFFLRQATATVLPITAAGGVITGDD